jgi:hypothetical protein
MAFPSLWVSFSWLGASFQIYLLYEVLTSVVVLYRAQFSLMQILNFNSNSRKVQCALAQVLVIRRQPAEHIVGVL